MIRSIACRALFVLFVAAGTVAADADVPFAGIPVGKAAVYHVVSKAVQPDGSVTATESVVRIEHPSATALAVQVDGGAPEELTVDPDGQTTIPYDLSAPLKPFVQIAAIMQPAPAALTSGVAWTSTVAVQLGDGIDRIPVAVNVSQASGPGATVVAKGRHDTTGSRAGSDFSGTTGFDGTASFDASQMVTSAKSDVAISIRRQGGGRSASTTIDYAFSWTATLAQP